MFDFLRRRPAGPATVTVEPFGWRFEVAPGQTILQAALANRLPWPSRCRVGSCTTCRCRLIEGEVRQLTDSSYVLSQEQLASRTILACQSQPKGDLRLHLEKARASLPADATDAPVAG